jgi:hypothetical protein
VLGYPKTFGLAGTPHMEPIPLEPIDALSVTVLVDNVTDSLLADMGPAKRAIHALAARFPDEFIPNAVGTRFEFQAAHEPRSEAAPPQRT